jgi:tetratricopeptide (TPR) repeat protein
LAWLRQPGWRRNLARAFLVAAVPGLLLLLVEGGLRLAGYGYPIGFFVLMEDGQTLTSNRRFTWRFMRRETGVPPYPVALPLRKPPGTLRIFLLGESAAQGTPAPAFGAARILEVMLQQQFPERRFEVVNAALRGINSHIVLPIARDCAAQAPDLFLVYMGNNEAIGLYAPEPAGFNVTPYRRLLRLGQAVKGTKLAQAFNNLSRALRPPAPRPEQDMAFFDRSRLRADDPRRTAIYDNFRANLDDLCRVARRARAQVVVSTVAVNLGDFPPLASLHRADLAAAPLEAWQTAFARGTNAEARGAWAEALTNYLAARGVDDHFAELHFRAGRCQLALGQFEEAHASFVQARDWDALQFRTDSRLNQITRDVVAARADPGVTLVDAERAFRDAADREHGIPGRRFFYEHVHLTFDGDYLLAATLLPAVAKALGLGEPGRHRPLPTRGECAETLGFSAWDELGVNAAMVRSTAKAPFLGQLEHALRQASAETETRQRTEQFHQQDGFNRSVATYRAALARRPYDWQIRFNFGNLLNDFGQRPGAVEQYAVAVQQMPVFLPPRIALAQALWDGGKRTEAIYQIREALRLDPDYAPAKQALAQAQGRQ